MCHSWLMLKGGDLAQHNKCSWNTKEMGMINLLILVIISISQRSVITIYFIFTLGLSVK